MKDFNNIYNCFIPFVILRFHFFMFSLSVVIQDSPIHKEACFSVFKLTAVDYDSALELLIMTVH